MHLLYGTEVYGNTTINHSNKLTIFNNKILHIIQNKTSRYRVKHLYSNYDIIHINFKCCIKFTNSCTVVVTYLLYSQSVYIYCVCILVYISFGLCSVRNLCQPRLPTNYPRQMNYFRCTQKNCDFPDNILLWTAAMQ